MDKGKEMSDGGAWMMEKGMSQRRMSGGGEGRDKGKGS